MTKQTLQIITVSKDGDEFVMELQSLTQLLPDLPVGQLKFKSLEECWSFASEWLKIAVEVARAVDIIYG